MNKIFILFSVFFISIQSSADVSECRDLMFSEHESYVSDFLSGVKNRFSEIAKSFKEIIAEDIGQEIPALENIQLSPTWAMNDHSCSYIGGYCNPQQGNDFFSVTWSRVFENDTTGNMLKPGDGFRIGFISELGFSVSYGNYTYFLAYGGRYNVMPSRYEHKNPIPVFLHERKENEKIYCNLYIRLVDHGYTLAVGKTESNVTDYDYSTVDFDFDYVAIKKSRSEYIFPRYEYIFDTSNGNLEKQSNALLEHFNENVIVTILDE